MHEGREQTTVGYTVGYLMFKDYRVPLFDDLTTFLDSGAEICQIFRWFFWKI